MGKLVILRGNSASGKTTTAKAIQNHFPMGKVMRISQDEVRRGMLNVKDKIGNPTPDLIRQLAEFGKDRFDLVLVEGIMRTKIYKAMLMDLYESFQGNVFAYYYDLSFEETLRRHSQRKMSKEFGAEQMAEWWLEHDILGLPNEKILTAELSQQEMIEKILQEIDLQVDS